MTCSPHSEHHFVPHGDQKDKCTKCGLVTCRRSCSPSDFHLGGKCDLAGCIEPRRIQLKRTKGWKMPSTAVKVDRTTKWGNPFIVGKHGIQTECVADFKMMVTKRMICGSVDEDTVDAQRTYLTLDIKELRGKHLACWCREGAPCHADILLKIANS